MNKLCSSDLRQPKRFVSQIERAEIVVFNTFSLLYYIIMDGSAQHLSGG